MNTLRALTILKSSKIAALQVGLKCQSQEEGGEIFEKYVGMVGEIAKEVQRDIEEMTRDEPMLPILTSIKGVGNWLAIQLIAEIDVEKAPTVSSLWRYAGMAVENGEADHPVKGEKIKYNPMLKKLCWVVGESLLRWNKEYKRVYDMARRYYEFRDWTPSHQHRAAKRKMVKIFLQHYWVTERKLRGLHVTKPYAHEFLGKTHYEQPGRFGWEASEG